MAKSHRRLWRISASAIFFSLVCGAFLRISSPVYAQGSGMILSMYADSVTCNGAATGRAWVAVSGGKLPYTYLWNGKAGLNSDTLKGIAAGSYKVLVTDALGDTASAIAQVYEPEALKIWLVSSRMPSCFGGHDGFAEVATSGGRGAHTVRWNLTAPVYGNKAYNLKGQHVSVSVQDKMGCITTTDVFLSEPGPLKVSVSKAITATCAGGNNGSIEVSVKGGVPPYKYTWNDSAAQQTAKAVNLRAGKYSVTVEDSAGCVSTLTTSISPTPPIVLTLKEIKPISCAGMRDASLRVTIKGGLAPYKFFWSGPTAIKDTFGAALAPGKYSLQVIDARGCSQAAAITIAEPLPLKVALVKYDSAGCDAATNGFITVAATGGTAPYQYEWNTSPIQRTATAKKLFAGEYTVIVRDARGCMTSFTFNLPQANPMHLKLMSLTEVGCDNAASGSISVKAFGGFPPYRYKWNDPKKQAYPVATDLKPGTYTVTVTDNAGCKTQLTATVSAPGALVAKIEKTDTLKCFGNLDGRLKVNIKGGVPPYDILWTDSMHQTGLVANSLPGGKYYVIVKDARGCMVVDSAHVVIPSMLNVQATIVSPKCYGATNGSIALSIAGGQGPYSIRWSNGVRGDKIENVAVGVYNVLISDARGCSQLAVYSVKQPDSIRGIITAKKATCGKINGEILVTAKGGVPPYTYLWSNGSTEPMISGLPAGLYSVVITDANGCAWGKSVQLESTPPMTVSSSLDNNNLKAGDTTVLRLHSSAPSAIRSISWQPNEGMVCDTCAETFIRPFKSGMYSATVIDINGCVWTSSVAVHVSLQRLTVANAFTPDRDDLNSYFSIAGPQVLNANWMIFDRWGTIIFRGTEKSRGWDGRLPNGSPAPEGLYLWRASIEYLTNDKEYINGNVMLMRN